MKKVEQFLSKAEPMKMSAGEKAMIRGRLAAFMESHPAMPSKPVASPYASGWTSVFSMQMFRARYVQAFLVILLASGGTVTAAANDALPGEPLYSVKVKFNEQVGDVFAFSAEAKVFREAGLAERRLREAADLSAQGRLTAEARTQIESNFENHVENIEKQVKKLAANDNIRRAVEVNSELESSLSVHEQVLLDLSDRSDEAGKVASTIRVELDEVAKTSNTLERKISNEVTKEAESQAGEKLAEAEDRLKDVRSTMESMRADLRPEAMIVVERHIAKADLYLLQGRSRMETGSYSLAFILFQKSLKHSKEAQLTIEASRDLDIDVSPDDEDRVATTTNDVATTTDESIPGKVGTSTDAVATTTASTTNETGSADVSATGSAPSMIKASESSETMGGIRNLFRFGL